MEIKWVPIGEIKPNPKNRNNHPKEQVDRLAEIITYQGWRHPLIVSNRSGLLVVGHGRLAAAKKLKIKEVPVVYQDFKDQEQEYSFGISDNAIASWAELDLSGIHVDLPLMDPLLLNLDMLGIRDFRFEPINEGLTPEDEIPEKVEPRTKLGHLYELGEHRLLCGDSTDNPTIEWLLGGNKVDMVFTDPPYGIDIYSKGSFHDGKKHGNALAAHNKYRPVEGDKDLKCVEFLFKWLKEFNGTAIVWGANNFPQSLTPSNGWLVWDKEQHANHGDCELAWTNVDKAIRMFTHKWVGFQKDSERGEKRVHPTQKPIALAEWAFDLWESPNTVLDLFGGSGSTLIACEKTNRKCFMMELDPHYCDVIVARWEKYAGKKAKLL